MMSRARLGRDLERQLAEQTAVASHQKMFLDYYLRAVFSDLRARSGRLF